MNKHKKLNRPPRPASIDGIATGGRSLGVPIHRSYQPGKSPQISDLDASAERTDGFHPMRLSGGQPLGTEAGDPDFLNDPIILEDEDPKQAKARQKRQQRKHKRAGHGKKRQWLKRVLIVLAVAIVVGLGFFGYKIYQTQKQLLAGGGQAPAVCDPNLPPEKLAHEGDGRINTLVVGIGGPEHTDGPNLTDTIMIASIDPVNHTASLLSVQRDLWVKVPGNGQTKVNAVYYYGLNSSKSKDVNEARKAGLQALESTLEPVIGLPIHYYVLIDFAALRQAVNDLGGIDINVPKELAVYERLWDEGTGRNYTLDVKAGQQHFDGTRALFFTRSRYTSPRGDFDRTERQKLVMIAIKDKIFTAGTLSNPVKVVQLLDNLGNNIYTNFDSQSIKCLYRQIGQIPSANIDSLDMAAPPNNLLTTGSYGNSSIVKPTAGLFEYDEIQAFLRKSLPDGFLTRENASVAIYNATDRAGLATDQADILKSYGYNVVTVDTATNITNPSKTVIVDLSKGKDRYTLNYLQKRYGVAALDKMPSGTSAAPPEGTHFVIILGRDASTATN